MRRRLGRFWRNRFCRVFRGVFGRIFRGFRGILRRIFRRIFRGIRRRRFPQVVFTNAHTVFKAEGSLPALLAREIFAKLFGSNDETSNFVLCFDQLVVFCYNIGSCGNGTWAYFFFIESSSFGFVQLDWVGIDCVVNDGTTVVVDLGGENVRDRVCITVHSQHESAVIFIDGQQFGS